MALACRSEQDELASVIYKGNAGQKKLKLDVSEDMHVLHDEIGRSDESLACRLESKYDTKIERLQRFLKENFTGKEVAYKGHLSPQNYIIFEMTGETLLYHDGVLYVTSAESNIIKTPPVLSELEYYDFYGMLDTGKERNLPNGHYQCPTVEEIGLPPVLNWADVDPTRIPNDEVDENLPELKVLMNCTQDPATTSDHTRFEEQQEVIRKSGEFRSMCLRETQHKFVKTTPYTKAKNVIEKEKAVLLLGESGAGKSFILHHIASHPMEDYLPVLCKNPTEIERYINIVQGSSIRLLLVLDDPVGVSYTQSTLLNEWVHRLETLEMLLEQNEHKFLSAMRLSLWADCQVHFGESPVFCHSVDVTSACLTIDDKTKLLEKHLSSSVEFSADEKTCFVNRKAMAFAQYCKILGDATKRDLHVPKDTRVQMYHNPLTFLCKELEKMRKDQYAFLCLVMLSGGELKCELSGAVYDYATDAQSTLREKISVALGLRDYFKENITGLQNRAEQLIGIYLQKSAICEVYKFSHESIHEALIMQYGQLHFGHCMEYLNRDFIVKIARPQNYLKQAEEFAICVHKKYYKKLAELFTSKVTDEHGNRSLEEIFNNPCAGDTSFQSVWLEYLTKGAPG